MLDIMYYHSIIGGKLLKLDHSEDDHGKFGGDGRSDEPFQEESEDDESSNVSVSTSHGGDKESPSPFSSVKTRQSARNSSRSVLRYVHVFLIKI